MLFFAPPGTLGSVCQRTGRVGPALPGRWRVCLCEPCPEEEATGVYSCLWGHVFNSGPTVTSHLSQALQVSFDQLLWSNSIWLLS